MSENKAVTEVAALRAVLAGEMTAGVVDKIEHMIEVRSRGERTPKRVANIALGEEFINNFNGDTFKASDVANVLGVSIPKASAICKAMGWETVPTTEKVNVYTL